MKQEYKNGAKNIVGARGETITANYLRNKDFLILDTNYLKPWGEIDVIAKHNAIVHFVEVKTVSYKTKQDLQNAVSGDGWRPEENVHQSKFQKLSRTIETWLLENSWEGEWQIDVAAIRIVPSERYATIRYLENIIIG